MDIREATARAMTGRSPKDPLASTHKKLISWLKKNVGSSDYDLSASDKAKVQKIAMHLSSSAPDSASKVVNSLSNDADTFLIDMDDFLTGIDRKYFSQKGALKISEETEKFSIGEACRATAKEIQGGFINEANGNLGAITIKQPNDLTKVHAFIKKAQKQFRIVSITMQGKTFQVDAMTGGRSRPNSFNFQGPHRINSGVSFWGRNPADGDAFDFFKGVPITITGE